MSACPEEFRRRATELVRVSGRPTARVAKELAVDGKALRRWVVLAVAGRAELVRLRRENGVLAMQVEILKKASAIFAKKTAAATRNSVPAGP